MKRQILSFLALFCVLLGLSSCASFAGSSPPQADAGGGVPEDSSPDEGDSPTHTCILSIECASVFDHLDDLAEGKREILPEDGVFFAPREVEFEEGDTVYDLLRRVCRENGIHMEASFTPLYGSSYVEGIGNLYEFDCGAGSGWMYAVDGVYPNFGCSLYALRDGQTVQWRYTCNLGKDIGGESALGE